MWPFSRRAPAISRQEGLAARPVRLVEPTIERTEDGGAKLTVKLRDTRGRRWFLRMPEGATKTFELDPIGLLVWENCDGKTSVQQIIRRLAKRYNLNLREAEVPTIQFLQTLVKKRLIGMPVKEKGK